ncbi:GNAT family N-acetyltransferase [Streptomyces sp. NPDC051907]|uniref:GNAT family N-acetyltransferase n=1 Tax=Streptomyces sp. NPDC051907 TaxID=3155284 RepID=UPI0034363557
MGLSAGIRQATAGDRAALGRLLEEAFVDDPVSRWIFPDPADFSRALGPFLGVFLDVALSAGRVDVVEGGAAAALWLDLPGGGPPGAAEAVARMRRIAGPDNDRPEQVGRLAGAVHPYDRAHAYLLLIAVTPQRQGQGLGTALIAPVLRRCDRDGVPAYLEASSARSCRLYERLGFAFAGDPVRLPDGPPMWPMWREPRA